jgi:hypothetical protein
MSVCKRCDGAKNVIPGIQCPECHGTGDGISRSMYATIPFHLGQGKCVKLSVVKVAGQTVVDFEELGTNIVVQDGQRIEVELSNVGEVGNLQVKMFWDERPIADEPIVVAPPLLPDDYHVEQQRIRRPVT